MKRFYFIFIVFCVFNLECFSQNTSLSNYTDNFGKNIKSYDNLLFIPIQYGCDDCNQKIIDFYKINAKNKKYLFIFVSKGAKTANIYLNKYLNTSSTSLNLNSNIIIDNTGRALVSSFLDIFPKIYRKKDNFRGVTLDNSNIKKMLTN